jgi:hypothetical protein
MPTFLRNASWHEVAALFPREADAIRNADGWAARFGDVPREYRRRRVVLESWSDVELAHLMHAMAEFEPRMVSDWVDGVNNAQLPPRVDGLPAALVRFGERLGMIDGKHRANRWKRVAGQYAVLVIEC